VRTGLQIRPIEQLHTRTALESRPHRYLFVVFEAVAHGLYGAPRILSMKALVVIFEAEIFVREA